MKLKKEHAIAGLLLLTGLVLLIYHFKKPVAVASSDSGTTPENQTPDVASQFQGYPSAPASASPLHNIEIGGSPINITYNNPTALAGEGEENLGSCSDCGCGEGATSITLVSKLNPSPDLVNSQIKDLQSVFG